MSVLTSVLDKCTTIRFGDVPLGNAAGLYHRLNSQVTALCRSLPAGMQAGGLTFFMEYFRIQVGESLDYFKNYYAPAWSFIYWVTALPRADIIDMESGIDHALCAQAMAMLLHSFDDHLVEGGIPVTHLALLARSQAWRRMMDAIDKFCAGLAGGSDTASGLIDDYYSGITERETPQTLDAYCGLFRKQMATWVIMPVLTARKTGGIEEFVVALRGAYESFGIAWRLLDDIQDLEADMADGTHSAVYVCLGDKGRALWDDRGKGRGAGKTKEKICTMIRDESILEVIAGRIVTEFDNAALLVDRIGLNGLAEEYRALAGPVKEWMR
jgi:hypothetical protein